MNDGFDDDNPIGPAALPGAVIMAATAAGGEGGLHSYLHMLAVKRPADFMKLLARTLPGQAQAVAVAPVAIDMPLTINVVGVAPGAQGAEAE